MPASGTPAVATFSGVPMMRLTSSRASGRSRAARLSRQILFLASLVVSTASLTHGQMSVGSYTGDDTDNREIVLGFQPQVVILKGNNSQTAICHTASMSANASKPLTGTSTLLSNSILDFSASGFTVGTD